MLKLDLLMGCLCLEELLGSSVSMLGVVLKPLDQLLI